jgi:hypothetical protein
MLLISWPHTANPYTHTPTTLTHTLGGVINWQVYVTRDVGSHMKKDWSLRVPPWALAGGEYASQGQRAYRSAAGLSTR